MERTRDTWWIELNLRLSIDCRNYYRCSTEGCNVKKRVERDRDDPRYVVTMYEGVHNHVSPGTVYFVTQDAMSGRFFVSGMHHPGP